jgi:apolipoprotein N-acyltransferase
MARRIRSPKVDLLILPESPSPLTFQSDASYRRSLEDLARRCRLCLVFNNVRSKKTENGERYFNSAYFLDGDGKLADIYDKVHLVPFGEYLPAKRFLFFIRTISSDVGEFSPGSDLRVARIGGHRLSAGICFEAVFPELMRAFVRSGSQLIINLTNDGWYGESAAPYQHFAIARWRAIENRRYLLRAANTGISAVIEPTGAIQAATGILREAICEGRIAFLSQRTFYTRYGDVLVIGCAIIAFGLLIYSLRRKK